MIVMRLAATAVLLCIVTACGGAAAPDPSAAPDTSVAAAPAAPAAPSEAAVDDETAVRTVFADYNQALVDGDLARACELSAPETVETLVAGVSQQLGQQVSTCEEAFGLIFEVPGAADITRQTAGSTEVQDVTVDGDTATVSWSAELQGQTVEQTNEMRRIDGGWRLVDTG